MKVKALHKLIAKLKRAKLKVELDLALAKWQLRRELRKERR